MFFIILSLPLVVAALALILYPSYGTGMNNEAEFKRMKIIYKRSK